MYVFNRDNKFNKLNKINKFKRCTSICFYYCICYLCLISFPFTEKKTPEEKSKQLEKRSKKFAGGTHVSGLDVGKVQVSLCISDDGLLISVPILKKEFKLSLNKIENLGYYNEVEVEKHLKSSFAGGVIGAATFGVAGAVIDSRPKEKQTRKVTYYLLIDYSDGQIIIESNDWISLDT